MEELLWTATVKSPFGISGEVKIHPHNDDCSYLGKLKEVILRAKDGAEQRLTIQGFRMMGS
ncbi:MAG: 16S rRNA processing protein RimM, partial [Sphaerochaeta associata]|nr:16S rRNA processing protein RimM [Sphaerochaeta associata]